MVSRWKNTGHVAARYEIRSYSSRLGISVCKTIESYSLAVIRSSASQRERARSAPEGLRLSTMRVRDDVAGEGMGISVRLHLTTKFGLVDETNGGLFEEIEAEEETQLLLASHFARKSANLIA